MTNGRSGSIVIAAALATLVAGMPVDAAKKKNRLRATVNGKLIKFKYNVQITAGGDTIAFFVIGQTRPRYGGLLRTLGVSCGDFPRRRFPGRRCTAPFKQWISQGMEVTVETLDGTRVAGTFRGTILPTMSNPSEPPVSVEGGRFSVFLIDVGV